MTYDPDTVEQAALGWAHSALGLAHSARDLADELADMTENRKPRPGKPGPDCHLSLIRPAANTDGTPQP